MDGTEKEPETQSSVAQLLRAMQRSDPSDGSPGRRLRIAILLRAFADVREGGRNGWDALRWLLDERPPTRGLSAQELMEELGLDVSALRRMLRASYGLGSPATGNRASPAAGEAEPERPFAKSA